MRISFAVLLIAATQVGCGRADAADAGQLAVWTVGSEPLASIGGNDERPEYMLVRTMGAARLSDGRIAVADGGASEVRIYDGRGQHLTTHGRAGQGPGEFQNIMQMRKGPGDTLVVLSFRPGLSWLDPSEGYVRGAAFSLWQWQVECRFAESNWHVLPNGKLFFIFEETGSCRPTPEGAHRNSGLMTLIDHDSQALDTVALLPATERDNKNFRPFGHMLAIGVGDAHIYAGDTSAESILVFDHEGRQVGSLPVPFEAQPVPSAARSEPIRRWTNPDTGEERVGAPYDYPNMLPPYGRLVPGPDGTLWVKAYPTRLEAPISSYQVEKAWAPYFEPGGSLWRVLEADGRLAAEVRLPERFVLLEVGDDYVLGISKDDFDVETVVVLPLVKDTQ